MSWAIEIVEVHRRPLLRGVSFGVPAQGVTAIVGGPDGARALLFRMIAGLEAPRFGAVIVLGQDMSRAGARDRKRLQRRLSIVFRGPDYALFAAATARANVALAVRTAGRVGRRGERAIVESALGDLGLTGVADALPGELAPAQRKRLAVARALALRSPLLVADGFDDDADAGEVAALAAVVREDRLRRGAAALLVMADAELAAQIADHVVELTVPPQGDGFAPFADFGGGQPGVPSTYDGHAARHRGESPHGASSRPGEDVADRTGDPARRPDPPAGSAPW